VMLSVCGIVVLCYLPKTRMLFARSLFRRFSTHRRSRADNLRRMLNNVFVIHAKENEAWSKYLGLLALDGIFDRYRGE